MSLFLEVLHTILKYLKIGQDKLLLGCTFISPLVSVRPSFVKSNIRVPFLEFLSVCQEDV